MVRVLIVGFGRHAQRIHYPAISELSGIEVVGVVDHQRHEEEIVDYLGKNRLPILSIDQETDQLQALTDFASELRVDAVVISTDPESHTVYAKWAFGRGYHVLMDKPIHAEPGAAHDRKRAIKIHKAYVDLQNELNRARAEHPNLVCEVLTQRRFHPAFQLVKKTVAEIYAKTGCPITYYYAFHNDGQWRTPLEISSIDYHGFNHGYGKASHSGYHFYDLLAWFSEDFSSDKKMDSIRVKAWPNFPSNYITQVSHDVLEKVFPDSKKDTSINASLYSDGFGEIDVMSTIQLKSGSNVVTHAQIDLQHSGLSARS